MFPFNQPGTSQKQASVLHRELNAAYSRKIHLERILVGIRYRYSRDTDTDPHHTQMATPLVKVLKDLVEICTDPSHTETVIPVVRVLRDWVKICDELINYQGQDKDKIQSYNTQKKWFKEALTKIVLTREQSLSLAESEKDELEEVLEIAKSHYILACDADRQQTATSLVRALRDFAEGWGEFGKYQEQDEDRIKSYTKQKEILETALAINRKGADHEKIAKMLRKWGKSDYSLKGFDKNNLDVEGVDPVEDAKTLHRLGNVHYRLKDLYREEKRSEYLKKAKEYYEKALNIRSVREFVNAHYSLNHSKAKECYEKIVNLNKNMQLEIANMLYELINANYDLKNPEEVKKCDEKVLDISKRISCIPEAEVAEMLNNLGSIEHALGNYQKAKEHFEKALPIFKKLNDNIKVATVLDHLGNVYRDSENREEAKKFFTDALSIYKDHGPEHIEVGIISNKLGNIYYSLAGLQKEDEAKELYEKAKNLHQEALPIYEKFYGPNHVEVAEVLDNLGDDYYALEEPDKANESYEKELIIYEKDLAMKEGRYGSNSVEVAEALRNLGNTYYNLGSTCYNLGDFRSVKESYKKELEIRKRHYDSYTTKVIDDYRANMFSKTNVPYIPIAVLEENYRKEKVSREIKIAETLGNLGDIYLNEKDYQKAEKSYKGALEHYGSDHPSVAEISEKLQKTTVSLTESLIKPLEETLAEKESNYPAGHLQIGLVLRDLVDACGELADVYGKLKDYQNQNESLENQKKLLKKALPILKENFGPTNTTVVRLNKLARKLGMPSSTLDSTSAQAASHSRAFF